MVKGLAVAIAFALSGGAWARARQMPSERGRQRLEREVRHALVTLPFYGVFDNLTFTVDGYAVTLLAQVTRPTLKSSAEKEVKRIEGVERVVNRIEVLPLSPNDDRIRRAVYRAVFGHPSLSRYAFRAIPPIHIIVKKYPKSPAPESRSRLFFGCTDFDTRPPLSAHSTRFFLRDAKVLPPDRHRWCRASPTGIAGDHCHHKAINW
jgi:hypothetical protein